jgi:branched-subunit amino acid aminotransferase/4-amino-4-deoxychorismate lyase
VASDSLSVRPEALLQHREFVVELARGLVGDAPRARLARPSRKEAGAATAESEAELRASLALQQKVVAVVLDLREPYRTILLLRYYARLSTAQIAARRGDTDLSIRAQLSRAIEILRERLDAECEGGRDAWTAGLLRISRPARTLGLLLKIAIVTVATSAVAIPATLWLSTKLANRGRALPPFAAIPPEPSASEPVSLDSVRAALPSRSVPELVQLAVQTQRTLRARLLEPPEDLRLSRAALLALPSTGLARLLHRGRLGSDDVNALGLRGAGSCFSFATHGHGWDEEPDLLLQEGHFISVGEGPGVLDLGPLRLEDLPESATPPPEGLGDAELRAWKLFWSPPMDAEGKLLLPFRNAARALRLGPATPMPGRAYLVRGITPGKHDVLAAFEAIAEDENGWTIAWRILRIGPAAAPSAHRADPYWWVPPPPAWQAEADLAPLIAVLDETRAAAQSKLFDPSPELRARFRASLAQTGTKLARLLSGERYAAVVLAPDAGSAYSFAAGKNVAIESSDLRIDGERYEVRLEKSACGVLLDYGVRTLESVGGSRDDRPEDLSSADREVWELLWDLQPADKGRLGRAIAAADEARVVRFAPARALEARLAHTYLLRSIVAGDHDVLVAFSTVDRDEHGTGSSGAGSGTGSSRPEPPLPTSSDLPDPRNESILVHVGGELVPRAQAKVSVFDSSVQGGDACWEGLRVYDGRVFRLEQHLDRLFASARALAFASVPSRDDVRRALFETLRANGMRDGAHVRLTLTRGVKVTSGMSPRWNRSGPCLIVLAEWKAPVFGPGGGASGLKLVTSSVRRNPPQCLDSKIHHANLLNNILAKIEAEAAGADDAVMLDVEGYVAETNATNLFLVRRGVLATPAADHCLPGITRAVVLEIARDERSRTRCGACRSRSSTRPTRSSRRARWGRSPGCASSTAGRSAAARADRSPRRSASGSPGGRARKGRGSPGEGLPLPGHRPGRELLARDRLRRPRRRRRERVGTRRGAPRGGGPGRAGSPRSSSSRCAPRSASA